jgi:hypothetical protein
MADGNVRNGYALWDFLDNRLRSVMQEWVDNDRLTARARAALNNKIRRLSQVDYNLAIGTKLLAGPIYKHVYKLVIHADVMLRPMLCRGPIDNETEYTFLLGAVETGGKLPKGSKEQAERNREVVISDPINRRQPHRRID